MPASSPADLNTLTPQVAIKIEGADLPDKSMASLLECVVESSLHLPDLCTLRIYDYDFDLLDSNQFKEGNTIEVRGGFGNDLKVIFEGEIVGLEMDLSADHTATIIVRAYDKSHRLHRGRKCATFVQVKDSDIVSKIAGEAGLGTDVKTTSLVRPWVLQNNQTDWEFLVDLAKRNGYDLFMKAGKLVFQDAGDRKAFAQLALEWGTSLLSFRPRTSATQQIQEVEVRGWDPIKKQEIVGTSKTPNGLPQVGGETDGSKAASKFGSQKKTVVVDQPIHSVDEAQNLAKSIRDQMGQDFLTAEGLCDGAPDLMAGTLIQITNIGNRFSGKYYVSSATHTYSAAEGYVTQFSVSGTQADTLLSLLEDAKDVTTSAIGGNILIGIVTDVKDPEQLGRIKVKYPSMAENLASYWARIVSQMAGSGRGFFNLPEVGDEVLVAFEHGDPTRPYVLGQLWNGKDKPPVLAGGGGGGSLSSGPSKPAKDDEVSGDGKIDRRGYYTRIGHKLDFSDKDGKGYIWLQTAAQNEMALSDAEKGIWIRTTEGHWIMLSDQHKGIKIKTSGGHEIHMDDQGKKILMKDSGGNSVTMDATGGKIALKANVEIDLSAPTIKINGQQKIENVAGMEFTVASGTKVALQAGTQMQLQSGGTLDEMAGGKIGITAPMVMINS